MHILFLNIYN